MAAPELRRSTSVTVEQLFAFERRYPGRHPRKDDLVRAELGIDQVRFEMLLDHAIDTDEAARQDPILTRHLREARARAYSGRASLLRPDPSEPDPHDQTGPARD